MIFDEPTGASALFDGNVKAYSVSELAFALKRTLEDAYGFVRVRGEISKVTRPASGHIYLSIKDEQSCVDAVVWRSSVRALKCQPQAGLEVIVTGKITTYPQRSSYQLIIDTMAPAGVGALLAQLERLKGALKAEGLFDRAGRRPLPATPQVIAVVTSPTGAVIRDILHRVAERWPTRVLIWPVLVQGAEAAAQVSSAILGLNRITGAGGVPRPDLIIVARGGGSVEDLWPFNDERLARTAAASEIPLISAVGHETDFTLIDYVADRRAPTPTAAAEMATPVLTELRSALLGLDHRMVRAVQSVLEVRRTRLQAARRGLPRPDDVLGAASQRFDLAQGRLLAALRANAAAHERDLLRASARLGPHLLQGAQRTGERRLHDLGGRLHQSARRRLDRLAERLAALEQLRRSLDPDRPLSRGFARVHRASGAIVSGAAALRPGDAVTLVFADGEKGARIEGTKRPGPAPAAIGESRPGQGDLF